MTIFLALLLAPLLQAPDAAPAGRVDAGDRAWHEGTRCYNCHGENAGEGAFGPDLAGARGLTFDQFRRAVRKPWGVMPSFTERQLPDAMLADMYAYLKAQPRVAAPGEWRFVPAPAGAPLAQKLYIETIGCGQCHEQENTYGRMKLGEFAKDVDFEYFAKQVYTHTEKYPSGRMGNYSRERLPESILREIYKWNVEELGLRASVGAALKVVARGENQTTFALNVINRGEKDKGLTVEGVTVFVRVPAGTKVANAAGRGYAGVMPLATLGIQPVVPVSPKGHANNASDQRPAPDLSGDVAVWRIPKVKAAESVDLSLTLSGPLDANTVKGFGGSTIHWENPGRRAAGKPPVLVYRDLKFPDSGDHERVSPPQMP